MDITELLEKERYETIEEIYKLNPWKFFEFIINNFSNIGEFIKFLNDIFKYNKGDNYIVEDLQKIYLNNQLSDGHTGNLFSLYSYSRSRYYNLLKSRLELPFETKLKYIKEDREKYLDMLIDNLINRGYIYNALDDEIMEVYRRCIDEKYIIDELFEKIKSGDFNSVLNLFSTLNSLEDNLKIDLTDKEESIRDFYYDIFNDNCENEYIKLKRVAYYSSEYITNPEYKNLTCSIELAKMFGIYFEEEELSKVKVRLKYFSTEALNRIAALSNFRRSVSKAIFNQIMENEKNN